jgi:hypothetical protein
MLVIAVGTRSVTVQALGTNRQVHLIPRINFAFKITPFATALAQSS